MDKKELKEKIEEFVYKMTNEYLTHCEGYERGDTELYYKNLEVYSFFSSPKDMLREDSSFSNNGNRLLVEDIYEFITNLIK